MIEETRTPQMLLDYAVGQVDRRGMQKGVILRTLHKHPEQMREWIKIHVMNWVWHCQMEDPEVDIVSISAAVEDILRHLQKHYNTPIK